MGVLNPGNTTYTDGTGERLNTGTLVAIPSTLSLKTHNSVSPYDSGTFQGTVPLLEPKVSASASRILYMYYLFGFAVVSHLTQADEILVDFHSQMLCGLLFLALALWAGEANEG